MADNNAIETISGWIERLRTLEVGPAAVAAVGAKALDRNIRENIAAGKGPDGTAWEPTKLGAKPLRNAGKALKVTAEGDVIVCLLTGPEAKHHFGIVKGGIRRQILPSKAVPDPVLKALAEAWFEFAGKTLSGE